MTSILTRLSAIAVGVVVAFLVSMEFIELVPCICLPEPALPASWLRQFLYDTQWSLFPAVVYAVAAAFGAAASTTIHPFRSTPIAVAIGGLAPFLAAPGINSGPHTPLDYGTVLAASAGGVLMAVLGQRIALIVIRRVSVPGVPSHEGPVAELRETRWGVSAYILRVVSLVNAVGAVVMFGVFVTEFAGPAWRAPLLARQAGLLVGLLGSIPTLVAARWMKENVAFKIAGVSLCSSFIAISFGVTASVAIHSKRGKLPYNDSAAVANLRTINTAEVTYASSGGQFGTIQELIDAGLLDTRFGGTISGYTYQLNLSGKNYTAISTPFSNMGTYGFYSTADGIVRYSTAASLSPRGAAGNPVQ